MPDDIDTSSLDKLQRALNELRGPALTRFKGRATYYVAVAIKGIIQPYKEQHKPVIWASEKQRRWYHWARRKDNLPLEYKRGSDPWSQNVQKSWTIARRETEATLGNRATYSPYVASDQYQTAQHKASRFTTDRQAAEEAVSSGIVKRIVDANIAAIVREAFRGL